MTLRTFRNLRTEMLESRIPLTADVFPISGAISNESIPGDANRDGMFDSRDLVEVFQEGKYDTGESADWDQGDWNGDGVFDSSDIINAFQKGNYLSQPLAAQGVNKDTSNVYNFPGPPAPPVVGTSELLRTPNGVNLQLKTTGLTPGNAYTVWWVIFNNPGECVDGCNGPDLAIPEVAGTLAFATGQVVGGNGDATFSAHLSEGDTSKYPTDFPAVFNPDVGLIDSDSAEIHVVVRDHGPAIPGDVSEQIHTFSGGCDINNCVDVQFAVHA